MSASEDDYLPSADEMEEEPGSGMDKDTINAYPGLESSSGTHFFMFVHPPSS